MPAAVEKLDLVGEMMHEIQTVPSWGADRGTCVRPLRIETDATILNVHDELYAVAVATHHEASSPAMFDGVC